MDDCYWLKIEIEDKTIKDITCWATKEHKCAGITQTKEYPKFSLETIPRCPLYLPKNHTEKEREELRSILIRTNGLLNMMERHSSNPYKND